MMQSKEVITRVNVDHQKLCKEIQKTIREHLGFLFSISSL